MNNLKITTNNVKINNCSNKNNGAIQPQTKIYTQDTGKIEGSLNCLAKIGFAGVVQAKNNVQEAKPDTGENTAIKMHHSVNGYNPTIRYLIDDIISGEKIRPSCADYIETIEDLDNAFENLKPLENECVVYRGRHKHSACESLNYDFEIIENAKIGDIVVPDIAYSYCAFDKSLAKCFANGHENNMIYEIKLPKGAKVSRNLEHGGEVLMPRSAQYKITGKKVIGSTTYVSMEYILPTEKQGLSTEYMKEYCENNVELPPKKRKIVSE
ncbi:hypothetical protein IKA92_07030 [bacterium]|nr:hypothetical protein [bacterium]